jgi:hypothetical protein
VTVSTIHQRLRDNMGLSASESSLRRWIGANLAEEATRNAVVVLRDTPPAGAEAQVDYGLLGRWFDPATQRWRRVWGYHRLGLLAPHVLASGAEDGPAFLGRGPRFGLRVLRWRPVAHRAGQPQDRGDHPRPL